MSTLVRKFLLGASYIHRMKQMKSSTSTPDTHTKGTKASNKSDGHNTLSRRTKNAIERARLLAFSPPSSPQPVAPQTPRRQTGTDGFFGVDASEGPMRMVVDQSPGGIRDALHVGANEHHSQHDKVSKRFAGRSNTSDDLALPQTPVKKGSRAAAAAAGAPKAGSEAAMGDGDKADSEHLPLDKDLMHHSSDDLAVVCPMVDGRLVDVARQE